MRRPYWMTGTQSGVLRRFALGAVVLLVLVAAVGLTAYLTRDSHQPAKRPVAAAGSSARPLPGRGPKESSLPRHGGVLPRPPSTHDPLAFGKAAAAALWSYDTRTRSRAESLAALRGWVTGEKRYADAASVDALVPSPALWKEMANDGQYATASAAEAHFPASFTEALQQEPGGITVAYVYAVTVTGRQSIAWKGVPHGGVESRAITLAVQCRPQRPCALAGVLPNVAP